MNSYDESGTLISEDVPDADHDLIPDGMHHVKATSEQTNHTEMMEMLGAIFVQLSRIYDVLITDSPTQAALDNKHSQGELFASPPVLKEEAWNVPEAQD